MKTEPSLGIKVARTDAPFRVKLVSAGAAACIADIITFPLDTTKVRLQVQCTPSGTSGSKSGGVINMVQNICRQEGVRGLYKGLVPGLQRQLCFSVVKVGCYDEVKRVYMDVLYKDVNKPQEVPVVIRILAGVTTGALSVCVAQPTDIVKVRMQAGFHKNTHQYTSSIAAYKTILTKEGIRGLWRGCVPNMTRNGIVNMAEVVTYDIIKDQLIVSRYLLDGVPCHLVSAFMAGFCATMVASPVDVVKTRYMNSVGTQYRGAIHCATVLWQEIGVFGFYKGFLPALLRIGTWNVCMFLCFEQLKLALNPQKTPVALNVDRPKIQNL